MSALTATAAGYWRPIAGRSAALTGAATALVWALIGAELAVLVAWLPDTIETWWRADAQGDFPMFYDAARALDANGIYAPALSLLLHPLTWLGPANAYRVYLALGAAAVLGVAWLAQRGVSSREARLAVTLGVLAVPQMHWALRFGHLTPFLALAALGGLLLLPRRPVLAGLCLAFLALKPQYLAVPGLYLLWTRNGRALASLTAGVAFLELAGFLAVGFDAVGPYLSSMVDWGVDSRDNLLPVQQAWQYAWPGFLLSAGFEANPLVVFDLVLLSLGAVVVAWLRGDRSVALAAAGFGMLLVTPYSNFYDWGLVAVGAALLLRADLRWPAAPALAASGLFGALLVSQQATPWPVVDLSLDMAGTGGHFFISPGDVASDPRGLYWITPAVLGAVCLMALAVRPSAAPSQTGERDEEAARAARPLPGWPAVARLALTLAALPAAYFAAAFVGDAPPFAESADPYGTAAVLRALPAGFPLPDDAELIEAGEGSPLPYHLAWTSGEPVPRVAERYRALLAGGAWELMLQEQESPAYRVRLARFTPGGLMTHWAMLDVSPEGPGSRITLDFIATDRLSIAPQGAAAQP
jgi:hypothetical protein